MSFTPGPWRFSQGFVGTKSSGYVPIRNPFRADAFDGPEGSPNRSDHTDAELDANAHLIAAAPDLLSGLSYIVECYDAALRDSRAITLDGARIDQMRAAIAKAKGAS